MVQRCKFSIELKNFPPDLSGEPCLTGILDNRLLSQALDYLRISSNIDYRIEDMKTDDSKGTNRTRVILWKGK